MRSELNGNRDQERTEQLMRNSNFGEKLCESGLIHVVQPGDTLYNLSQKYHVSVSEIMYKNPYANVYHLRPGDELCIPVLKNVISGC